MYAIFEDGSRQYRVTPGDFLRLDLREGAAPGEQITFDRVLLFRDGDELRIGRPVVEGAAVVAEVLDHVKGPKLEIQKMRRRKANSRRHTGHRQKHTEVEIVEIRVEGYEARTAPSAADGPHGPTEG